jgi:hypothetical protein
MCDTSPVKKKNKAPVQPHYKSGNEYKKKRGKKERRRERA